jgi:colanic acid/amylovoran biosynthesis glycosyltransferase
MLAADVFLHPAVSEGFCNAVIEAQAMTLPVVCSDADGLAENVAHGRTGFVVPRRDPDALAAPLIELAADRALRRRIGRAGRERVLSRFTLPDQIRAFDTFYRSVLGMPPSLEDEPAAVPDARAAIAS